MAFTERKCDHCDGPIVDEYPVNLHVMTIGDSEWTVHADCYWEFQVQMIEEDWMAEPDDCEDCESLLDNLLLKAERLERTVKAHKKLRALIKKAKAEFEKDS